MIRPKRSMRSGFLCFSLCVLAIITPRDLHGQSSAPAAGGPASVDPDNAFYALPLEGFFLGEKRGKPKRLNVYLVRRAGVWAGGLGTATIDGKAVWNTALMPVDASKLVVRDGHLSGTADVTLVPDPWIPADQKVRHATLSLDVAIKPARNAQELASLIGTWSSTVEGDATELKNCGLAPKTDGKVQGGLGAVGEPADLSDTSYDLAIYNLVPGNAKENFSRRRALSIGIKDGKAVSARFGQMDLRSRAYDYQPLDVPENMTFDGNQFKGAMTFDGDTLDGERASFTIQVEGYRVSGWLVGTWSGKYATEDGKDHEISGYFRGDAHKGAVISNVVKDDRPWFSDVEGFKKIAPGQHPRLFFSKADVPELQRRAATPEGRRIINRLRELLNGSDGESMPTLFNPAKAAYEKGGFKYKPGAYSISHGAGFGFLYQLTGDKKYAELAKQCVDKGLASQRNFDDRYAWVAPGGELRAGPSIAWTAVAYDLCYDAWDDDYRQKIAQAIQNYSDTKGGEWNNAEGITLRTMILQTKQGPGSNHYGAVIGGCGLAVLAIQGDPGTDRELISKYIETGEREVIRNLSAGWGDGGYYSEGWGASTVGTQGAFLCYVQALKNVLGHDYANVERTNLNYLTMVPRCLMILGSPAVIPYRSNMGSTYGSENFYRERDGFSHGGHFCENFGALGDKYKPGLLWIYNHEVQPDRSTDEFDTLSGYPHRCMMALLNWPTFSNIAEKNPAEVMPLATRDHLYEYFVCRNRFEDKQDIVTTVLIKQPDGTKPRDVMVWGLGERINFGEPRRGAAVTQYSAASDGSALIATEGWAIAVDYSKASGADGLVVNVGSNIKPIKATAKMRVQSVKLGDATINILTLCSDGKHPDATVSGETLVIGGQVVAFKDGKLSLAKFAGK